ncbi:hypothetical protein ABT119_32810 [Streptomyces sp. NPDC001910]|uniref:hypothetical protein n=1 Tax=Streptomyces sp. NPDC001910 TaxID=3154403 RepID=UPI0033280028
MRSKVESIAARLSGALNTEVRRSDELRGVRLEADLPSNLGEEERAATLAAISEADSFGHQRTGRGDLIWAFIARDEASKVSPRHKEQQGQKP